MDLSGVGVAGVVSLGMYPDETCFDPTRSSWLPYWLDDLTESKCKMNLLVSGNTTGNTAQAGQPGADAQTVQNARAACVNAGGTWDDSASACSPSLWSQITLPMMLALGGLVAVIILRR